LAKKQSVTRAAGSASRSARVRARHTVATATSKEEQRGPVACRNWVLTVLMLSEVRSTVRYRNWNARWNGGGTACSFGGLGHDVARPDGGDAGLGEAAGVVGDGVDELAGAQAVGEGVAGAQPHHEAAAGELRHLHHERDVERLHARRGVR